MEDIYKFVVEKDEFDKILNGKKVVQLALNSKNRRDYAIGNQISFSLDPSVQTEEGEPQEISAVIENLFYFADIREAVVSLGREKCGLKPSEAGEVASDKFLKNEKFEDVQKNGIVAIEFKIIKKDA